MAISANSILSLQFNFASSNFDAMTLNPFDEIAERLTRIEMCLLKIQDSERPNSNKDSERPLTIKEAAELLRLSIATLYSKVSRGELPGVSKISGRLYFDKGSLLAYIKRNPRKTGKQVLAEALNRMAELNKKRVE